MSDIYQTYRRAISNIYHCYGKCILCGVTRKLSRHMECWQCNWMIK